MKIKLTTGDRFFTGFNYLILILVAIITLYPPVEFFDKKTDLPLELVSIDGVIADFSPHLHMTISNKEAAFAGHLEEGCRVLYLAEIVIQELSGLEVHRIRDEKNLLKLSKK